MDIEQLDRKKAIYQRLGQAMLASARTGVEDLWLLVLAGDGWIDSALFEIGDGTLTWCDPQDRLWDDLFALWELDPPAKRWSGMVFEIHSQNFTSEFYYEGELPEEGATFPERSFLISRRFANFTVLYPSHNGQ